MAPTKTLYVKEKDVPLWERFEKAVNDWQAADSVSALIAVAMQQYLDQYGDRGDGLYVRAPDEDAITFGEQDALLEPGFMTTRGLQPGWTLSLDGSVYGGEDVETEFIPNYEDMTRVVAEAKRIMAEKRAAHQAASSGSFGRIEVECDGRTEAFTGRWLVEPDSDMTRADESDYEGGQWDAGAYYGVALTKHGNIAVYVAHCNEVWPGQLNVFNSLDDLDEMPPSIVAQARAELTGAPVVIERDI